MPVASEQLAALCSVLSQVPATDSRACERFQVDGFTPAAIAEPVDARELIEVVRWARAHHTAMLPVTTGLYLPVGNPPAAADVAVSMAQFQRVLYYDPGDLTLGVEPGISLAQVQQLLAENGLFLPADPPYGDPPEGPAFGAAVGGLVATHASGPLRFAYGTWRDFVVGMKFVTGEGALVKTGGRVVKNVAGYDLSKMMIGSLGTLGIITEINFKLAPRPPESATFIFAFAQAEGALATRNRIVHSTWQPQAIELLDPRAAALADSPDLSPEHWSLVVSVGGVSPVIERYRRDFNSLAHERQAASFNEVEQEDEKALWNALRSFLPALREANPATSVVKAALPISQIGPFLARALQVAERYELPAAATAHAGSGIAFVYLHPPAGMADGARRMAQAATEMIHAGNNLAGRVTLPWCPTEVKRDVSPWGPLRDDFALMKKLKQQFDPDRILNPGRFVGGL
jgi:glycolate oxidase FAD binding subunit